MFHLNTRSSLTWFISFYVLINTIKLDYSQGNLSQILRMKKCQLGLEVQFLLADVCLRLYLILGGKIFASNDL